MVMVWGKKVIMHKTNFKPFLRVEFQGNKLIYNITPPLPPPGENSLYVSMLLLRKLKY